MTTAKTQALTFSKKYETATIRLTSKILRIGGAVSMLNPYEYVQDNQSVYLPNQEALARVLLQTGKLQQYIQKIEDKEDIKPLLQNIDQRWYELKDSQGISVFPRIGMSSKWVEGNISDLRPMIRNGFGEPYIPGSSIKGAMRTAIAFYLLKNANKYNTPNEARVSAIEKQLREKLDNKQFNKEYQKEADDGFMSSFFDDFSLYRKNEGEDKEIHYPTENEAQRDILRVIKISDSTPLLQKTFQNTTYNLPIVTETIVSSHFDNNNAKSKASLYTEMVFNVRTEFTITLDREMLSWFKHNQQMKLPFKGIYAFNNIDDLLKICQEFSQYQWDGEYDYWNNINNNYDKRHKKYLDFDNIRDFYEIEQCPYKMRLGWGTGMGGTTIINSFKSDLQKKIRDTCSKKTSSIFTPKSRRTILDENGDIRYAPGWVKLEKL